MEQNISAKKKLDLQGIMSVVCVVIGFMFMFVWGTPPETDHIGNKYPSSITTYPLSQVDEPLVLTDFIENEEGLTRITTNKGNVIKEIVVMEDETYTRIVYTENKDMEEQEKRLELRFIVCIFAGIVIFFIGMCIPFSWGG